MSYLKIAVSGKLGVAIKKNPILYIKACTDDVSYVYLFCINELRCVSDVTVSGDVLDCNLKIFCKRLITVVVHWPNDQKLLLLCKVYVGFT